MPRFDLTDHARWILATIAVVLALAVLLAWCMISSTSCTTPPCADPVDATACAQVRETQAAFIGSQRATIAAQEVWGTAIPPLETRVAGAESGVATAVALATQCWQPTATERPTPRPTETATPMPPSLCTVCTVDADCRPVGSGSTMLCRDCTGATGRRCVRSTSPNGDCTLCRLAGVQNLGSSAEVTRTSTLPEWSAIGIATYYTDVWTASGEPFGMYSMTCSVDESLWPMLSGLTLRVTVELTGKQFEVYANDWGRLNDAGWFACWDEESDGRTITCCQPTAQGFGWQVVIDLPEGTYKKYLTGRRVKVEVVR